jgi:hypothetical protein
MQQYDPVKLQAKGYAVPFLPKLTKDPLDTSNFSSHFTKMEVAFTNVPQKDVKRIDKNKFKGFDD